MLVEFDRPIGYFHLIKTQLHLQDLLGVRKVDLVLHGPSIPNSGTTFCEKPSMSRKKWPLRVRHILEAVTRIQEYTSAARDATFGGNRMMIDAVIRNFQVIGEAARRVPATVQAIHPEIPWALMCGMRNVLVHDYDEVDLETLWRTVRDDLPALIDPLSKLLEESP